VSVVVREAQPGDVPAILALIRHLAAYERKLDAVEATEASLHATFFAHDAKVHAHVAESGGALIGAAVWFLNYSTWTGRPGIFLEDLVVHESARGSGAGRAMLEALGREARARDCARIDWAVLDWNESAMAFYRRIGGRPQTGWQPWRIDGPELARLGA
jgi:GNAT superfamily N-acetyltransferase